MLCSLWASEAPALRSLPHSNHLSEAAGLKDGGYKEEVGASIYEVTERLVIRKPEARTVWVLPCHLTSQRIELALQGSLFTAIWQLYY